MLYRIARPLFWLVILAALGIVIWQRGLPGWPAAMLDPASEAAFEQWIDEDATRRGEFQRFEAFLRQREVADIVPSWQLTRIDRFYARRCEADIFRIPPESVWPNIVPALRLVRDEVEPVVGEVSVQSSWRTPALNACAGGGSRSRHMDFAALDLRLEGGAGDLDTLYRELCAMHEAAGPSSRMGLGAYYDRTDDGFNRGGRFHIDAAGYRAWGRSYTAASSPCGRF